MAQFKVQSRDALWRDGFSSDSLDKLQAHLGSAEMWITDPETFEIPGRLADTPGEEVTASTNDSITLLQGLQLAVITFDWQGAPQVCVVGPTRESLEIIIPEDSE